jgi:hypothetical protein
MCDNWREIYFDKYSCSGSYSYVGDGELEIKGKLKVPIENTKIQFLAANPPNYIQSYSGSGLPFANPEIAYENTKTKGFVMTDEKGNFSIRFRTPNSYYTALGTLYQKPHIQLKIISQETKNIHSLDLSEGIPFRLLTYPSPPNDAPRSSPLFYNTRHTLPVRTQEEILINSGYPSINKMPNNFWGKAVPHP